MFKINMHCAHIQKSDCLFYKIEIILGITAIDVVTWYRENFTPKNLSVSFICWRPLKKLKKNMFTCLADFTGRSVKSRP